MLTTDHLFPVCKCYCLWQQSPLFTLLDWTFSRPCSEKNPTSARWLHFLQLVVVYTRQDKKDEITSIIYHWGRSTLNLSAVVQTSCCCITGCRQHCCKTEIGPHYPVSTNPSNTFHLGSALCNSNSLRTHSIKLMDWTVLRLQVQCPVNKTALEISHLWCHKGRWCLC